ncbi:uncharacterized protein LOC108912204 [Anoplophora glabripennis]|uniref:uncharacterized protein LOC108912204 n=1 Tax=Anoplophora glabripennis TaxID=217634 RepID=UPI0008754DBE|nr:uncharacterized protein LOC108912204 [Anoplophora glabripennis]
MANFKLFSAVAAILIASCVGASVDIGARISDDRNIDQCNAAAAKVKLLQTNIYEPAKFLLPVTRTLNYPESGLNTHRISCLKVMNMDTGDHGGHPEVISGGVGSYDVQIRLTSQWGQPLNFRVEIWAEA